MNTNSLVLFLVISSFPAYSHTDDYNTALSNYSMCAEYARLSGSDTHTVTAFIDELTADDINAVRFSSYGKGKAYGYVMASHEILNVDSKKVARQFFKKESCKSKMKDFYDTMK
ncbi:TPA: hypothetical protein P0E24_001742 [Vibrio campbellii]|nr:hypothetical protein [Vibrio campbellii]HDM8242676.1 hypothetical protein [Vibrio campbellii]